MKTAWKEAWKAVSKAVTMTCNGASRAARRLRAGPRDAVAGLSEAASDGGDGISLSPPIEMALRMASSKSVEGKNVMVLSVGRHFGWNSVKSLWR